MSKIISCFILLVTFLSLFAIASGKTCTKEIIHSYMKYKMNTFTQRLTSKVENRKSIVFVCCEGYIENGRRGSMPKCSAICNIDCGHGVCYTPNSCTCELGYQLSADGTCIADESKTTESLRADNKNHWTTTGLDSERHFRTTTEKTYFHIIPTEGRTDLRQRTKRPTDLKTVKWSTEKSATPSSSAFIRGEDNSRKLPNWTTQSNKCGTCHRGTCNSGICVCPDGYKITQEGNCQALANRYTEKSVTTIKNHWTTTIKRGLDPERHFRTTTEKTYFHIIPTEGRTDLSQRTKRPTDLKTVKWSTEKSATPSSSAFIRGEDNSRKLPNWTTQSNKCGTCHRGTCNSGICVCPDGYKITQEGNCQPICYQSCLNGQCVAPNFCKCLDGYTYDSESRQCKPLCNGKIYGCIRGTCVGYNQCRCDNGTALLKDELFHCLDGGSLKEQTMNWRWYLLLLFIPAMLVILSFCFVIKRWKKVKANRLEAQGENFAEVRYYNSSNDHSITEKHQRAMDEPSCSYDSGILSTNRSVLIINS